MSATGCKNAKDSRRALIATPLLALALVVSLASCSKQESASSRVVQKTFASPDAAGQALFEAAKAGDQNALMSVFGPEAKDLLLSGDAVKDKNAAQHFVDAYSQMHRWGKSKSGEQVLYIGADNFAFPIPLKQDTSGQWAFDTAAGKDEVLARRIGDGELTAIGVLSEVANAQEEYFSQNHQFAQKFVSDNGQRDGLYWPVADGQKPSPLGPLADVAKDLGYSYTTGKPQPFNGYYYRILTKQAEAAKGGAEDYLQNGKMTGGFALLAWPAKYQDSGIMTFIVGKDGVVYQKDLGDKTADAGTTITAFDPGNGWNVVLSPESANASTGAPNLKD
jgi:hypothetical protein